MSDINCNFLNNGKCDLASEIAGFEVRANTKICEACIQHKDHGSDNPLITSQIHWEKRERKMLPPKLTANSALRIEDAIGDGPGTELHKLIPSSFQYTGCNCKNFAKRMNMWGPDKCEIKMEVIVNHLVEKSKESPLLGWVPASATRFVAERLTKKAIARSRKKGINIVAQQDDKFNWFVAVTTAPRKPCTLQKCLQSLDIAGFDPIVFAEPGSTKVPEYETIRHDKKKGIWHNWLYACRYALENSDADVIMTVQDDSLFHPDSKTFAESVLWPSEYTGFVSLYTPKHYSIASGYKTKERPKGINRIHTKSMWGACALIWPREVLVQLLDHDFTKNWFGAPTRTKNSKVMLKRKKDSSLVANSDTAIGQIMNKMGRYMFFVDPSPVEHVAITSTISHGDNTGRRNCMRCAEWGTSLSEQVPIDDDFQPVSKLIFEYRDENGVAHRQ